MHPGPSILVSAGELSGDRLAAPVVAVLRRRRPGLRFFGWGGRGLEAAGVELLARQERLAVTGVDEALRRGPAILGGAARLLLALRRGGLRLALLVDYPGFNLRLGAWLRRRGVPVLYLGAPQRWAWLAGRTAAVGRSLDRLVVCLPFEARWFEDRGVRATFLGHPILDTFRLPEVERARAALRLPGGGPPVLCLMPGSRDLEIRRHLPRLQGALRLLGGSVRPLLLTSVDAGSELCARLAPELPQASPPLALAIGDAALCASGTATLEAALAGVPSAAFYRLSLISHALARRLVRVRHIALPNLILDEPVLPELIQGEVTPQRLAAAARELLGDEQRARALETASRLREVLGPPGAAERIADLAEDLMV